MSSLEQAKNRTSFLLSNLKDPEGRLPIWSGFSKEVIQEMVKGDFSNLCNWPVIRKTMFCIPDKVVLQYLKESKDWSVWEKVLQEDSAGNPPTYGLLQGSSSNLIHHVYHVAKFVEKTKCNVADLDEIVEFGGGFGSLCRVFYKLGFKGRYIIYDLPEFNILQEYYLSQIKEVPKILYNEVSSSNKCVVLLCNMDMFHEQMSYCSRNSIFVATWSISETPLEFRNKFFDVLPSMKYFLMAYLDVFVGIENKEFFDNFAANKPEYIWMDWKIEHFTSQERYIMGMLK